MELSGPGGRPSASGSTRSTGPSPSPFPRRRPRLSSTGNAGSSTGISPTCGHGRPSSATPGRPDWTRSRRPDRRSRPPGAIPPARGRSRGRSPGRSSCGRASPWIEHSRCPGWRQPGLHYVSSMMTALVSRMGGVGKTTTAVILGAALASQGKRVLLVDLDPQSSASLSLGVPRDQLGPSSADVLLHNLPAWEAVRPTSTDGLSLITASADLQRTDAELSVFNKKEGRLKAALAPLKDRYDHILLDCPSSLSLLPVNALVASNAFIVPASPQYLAITGVMNLIGAADRLAWTAGARTLPLGIRSEERRVGKECRSRGAR